MIGTLAGFRAYAADRGDMAPTSASDDVATAALVRASDHIIYDYVARFSSAYDVNAPLVEPATYEAARLELKKPGLFSRTFTPGERKVLTGLGDLEWTVISAGPGGAASPVSTRVEAMLAGYIGFSIGVMVV